MYIKNYICIFFSLRGAKITDLYGNVDIMDNNSMSINIGFTFFSLTANISLTG